MVFFLPVVDRSSIICLVIFANFLLAKLYKCDLEELNVGFINILQIN